MYKDLGTNAIYRFEIFKEKLESSGVISFRINLIQNNIAH